MKIVVIIPSRYGSTRFDGKPLALIAGKPMIRLVYEKAIQAERISDVFVATDDQRIYDAVLAFGGKAVMTSAKNRSGTDRVAEAAEKISLNSDDIVVNVQGDQPLLNPVCINELVEPFFVDQDLGMSTLAFKIINKAEITNPKDVKVTFDIAGFALYFSRSAIPYGRDFSDLSASEAQAGNFDTYKHLGFYAYTKWFLEIFRNLPEGRLETIEKLEQLRALEYGHKIKVVLTGYDSPEVDLPEDIAKVEQKIMMGVNTDG
ncbi:MAG: 3-deoxy-manno-octulosonate cytidylyltransferase [Desulfobacterales bacterium]|nr:3-deoxy-manno-octulosonate cytidylyltransferase [Desulfobacterales bacterium]